MKFVEFHRDDTDLTQVFVHGYEGAQSPRDVQRLAECIGASNPQGCCYLLCWGDWQHWPGEPDGAHGSPAPTSPKAEEHNDPEESNVLQRMAITLKELTREAIEPRGKYSWVDGVGAAAWETLRFWSHAAEAERVGSQFCKQLEYIEIRQRLRLWGHSLGARLLLAALSHPQWDREVDLAVLMGAAADAAPTRWRSATPHTRRLVNVYSTNDLVLRIAPLWTAVAGLRPIDAPGVENLDCTFHHHEYWQRLNELVVKLRTDQSTSAAD